MPRRSKRGVVVLYWRSIGGLTAEAAGSGRRRRIYVGGRQGMQRRGKIALAVTATIVAGVAGFSTTVHFQNEANISQMKAIADRLQTSPGWEPLGGTQPPLGGAFCIPIDGPCATFAYQWDTHTPYIDGDLERYMDQVGLTPNEYEPCVREQRFNSGGLSCRGVGTVDGWDVRITIDDYGPESDGYTTQIAVLRYGY